MELLFILILIIIGTICLNNKVESYINQPDYSETQKKIKGSTQLNPNRSYRGNDFLYEMDVVTKEVPEPVHSTFFSKIK